MEEEEITEEDEEIRKAGAVFSPEGIVMLPIAILFDLFGFILTMIWLLTLFGVATLEIPEIINWASDVAGLGFFGLWLLFRAPFTATDTGLTELEEGLAQRRTTIKSVKKELNTAKRGMSRGLRFGIACLGEIITVVGALPFWTWFVYSELKR